MTSVSQLFVYLIYILFSYFSTKGLYDSPDFFSLVQLQEGQRNKVMGFIFLSQFMQPLIHQYNQKIDSETENYCPVLGEALLFILLENSYNYWAAELERKNKLTKETAKTTQMSTQKFTTCTQGGNSRPFGG